MTGRVDDVSRGPGHGAVTKFDSLGRSLVRGHDSGYVRGVSVDEAFVVADAQLVFGVLFGVGRDVVRAGDQVIIRDQHFVVHKVVRAVPRIRRRFTSVAELTEAISAWAEHWNIDAKPFIWKATTEDIIAKVQRGREALHQIKSATDH
jgi:hypothetical protein